MNLSLQRCLCILALLGPLTITSTAVAGDVAAADALFNRGVAELEAGNYKKGCPLIAESLRVDPQPGTLFALSQCEVKWGRIATAVVRLDEYLQVYDRLTPDQKAQQINRFKVAKGQRDKLALEVPELTLSLPPGAPAGTVVKRDDEVVASATLGIGLPVDPGEHVVSTQVPGGVLWEQRITIVSGEKKPLVLEVKMAPSGEARPGKLEPTAAPRVVPPSSTGKAASGGQTPAPVSPKKGGVPAWAWAAGGVGVAALGAGVAFAVDHASARRTLAADCPGDVCDSARYSLETMQSLRGRWNRDLGLAVGLGAAGVVGVSIAAVGIARGSRENRLPPSSAAALTPWLSPNAGGAFISGDF